MLKSQTNRDISKDAIAHIVLAILKLISVWLKSKLVLFTIIMKTVCYVCFVTFLILMFPFDVFKVIKLLYTPLFNY